MYTEEDVVNLSEFLHLTKEQVYWGEESHIYEPFSQLSDIQKRMYRDMAKVALEFKEKKECKCF